MMTSFARHGLNSVARYVASLVLLFGVWYAAVVVFEIKPFLLPSPVKVFQTLWTESAMFAEAAGFTFGNMIAGGAIGIGFGLLIGFLFAYSVTARWLGEPYLVIFQSFPRESLLPLIIVWLGFGAASKIANAAMLSFFPVAVIVLHAIVDTRRDYLQLLDSLGASKFQQFIYCRLPYAVPAAIGALKVGLPLSLIGAVLGEFMGGGKGLGNIIISAGSAFRIDRVFAAVVVLAIAGTLLHSILSLVEKTVCRRFLQSEN